MRIAVMADPTTLNVNYRAYQPMQALSRRGHTITANGPGAPRFRMAELLRADVVHIHRFLDERTADAAEQVRAAGIGVVWDNDDDITAFPRGNPLYRTFGGVNSRKMVAAVRRIVQLADVITTPSAVLAQQYRDYGGSDVRVIENYLPREFVGRPAPKRDGVTVGWVAALEHQLDYQGLRLQETLGRLLDKHAELHVASVGLGLGLSHDRYHHTPRVPFMELPGVVGSFDIGIAPLDDFPFNRARSNVKLKEYAAAGVPWLASPVGAYAELGYDEGGRQVAPDQWFAEIERLIEDQRLRRKLAKRAARWGKRQIVDDNVDAWESVFIRAAGQR